MCKHKIGRSTMLCSECWSVDIMEVISKEPATYNKLIRKIFNYTDEFVPDDDILGALLAIRDELGYYKEELYKANTVLKGKEEIIELLKGQLENAKR